MLRYWRLVVFVAVSGVLTFVIATEIAGFEGSTDRYDLVATFDDVTNLGAGDPVKLSGVRVGTVSNIELVTGEAIVAFAIDTSVALPTDSRVLVQAIDLLGRRQLRLEPGVGTTMLTDGDEMTNTTSAVHLGDLINELGPLLEAVRPDQVNALVGALNDALAGNRETISGLTRDLAAVLDSAASRSELIGSLIDDYSLLVGEVASRDTDIGRLLENLVRLTETFQASEDVLVSALEEIPAATEGLRVLLEDSAADVESILEDLAAITTSLRPRIGDIDTVVAGLPTILEEVWSVVDGGEYVRINFACVASTPPPCPSPVVGADAESPGLAEVLLEVLSP